MTLRSEDAAGWRELADGALAWFVHAPAADPPAAVWLDELLVSWPTDPQALLERIGAAARGVRFATGAAARWSHHAIDVAWAGDVRAVLVRDGRAGAATTDHSMAHALGVEDPYLAGITQRTLGDVAGLEHMRWLPRPGDTLLLCAPHVHEFRPEGAWLPAVLDPDAAPPGCLLLQARAATHRDDRTSCDHSP